MATKTSSKFFMHQPMLTRCLRRILILVMLAGSVCLPATAQKLPSAEKVINNYLKAIGGKKRVAKIRDATYEWTVQLNEQPIGAAKMLVKAPDSARIEMTLGLGQLILGVNMRTAWMQGMDGKYQTLTGAEAAAAKLQAALDASHLLDIKKRNVLARVTSIRQMDAKEFAYVVEFSLRSGARLKYLFSTTSKLLIKIEDDELKSTTRFADYRSAGDILEPHRVRLNNATGDLTFALQRVTYNTGVPDSVFDPPRAAEKLDVVALLREVSRNQDELEKRFTEYAFRQTQTDREISAKGELRKETIKVYEVFPIANREPVMKLLSENGVALSGERAANEQRRVEEEFSKAEREKEKDEQRVQKRRLELERKKAAARQKGEDDDLDISQFLKIHEFVSPRRERFRDRDAVVFDFRTRPGFKPGNRQDDLISKLIGVVWIDPADKQIMRLEAKLAEGFKMAGGLLFSLRPGAAFVMEQTRMVEGVWLPRQAQINLTMKYLLFGGGDLNKTIEWSDYKHFSGDVGDYKLDAPKSNAEAIKLP